jgi:alpha,alpha-trehalase
MVYPLFFGMATEAQADITSRHLSNKYVCKGGLQTTLHHTVQQWDAPNGWAPVQWMAVKGLERYGHIAAAEQIAQNWIYACESKFERDHKMIEKYNVEAPLTTATGGEYAAQDGFGWTNGVYLALKSWLRTRSK